MSYRQRLVSIAGSSRMESRHTHSLPISEREAIKALICVYSGDSTPYTSRLKGKVDVNNQRKFYYCCRLNILTTDLTIRSVDLEVVVNRTLQIFSQYQMELKRNWYHKYIRRV